MARPNVTSSVGCVFHMGVTPKDPWPCHPTSLHLFREFVGAVSNCCVWSAVSVSPPSPARVPAAPQAGHPPFWPVDLLLLFDLLSLACRL